MTVSKFLYDLTSVATVEESDHDLTGKQAEGLEIIQHFINDNETHALIISGALSTGKTTLLKKFISKTNNPNPAIKILTAGSRIAEQVTLNSGLEAHSLYRHIYNFNNTLSAGAEATDLDLDKSDITQSDISQAHYSVKNNPDGEDVIYIIEEAQLLSDSFNETELFIFGSGRLLKDLIQFIDPKNHPKRKLMLVGDTNRLGRGVSFPQVVIGESRKISFRSS